MWAKVGKWLGAVGAFLALFALGVGYALRQKAAKAAAALGKAREQDALERGRGEADRARLTVIEGELAKPTVTVKRTAAQILAEQRRRGQLKE